MPKTNLIAGLDIGSGTIKALLVARKEGEPDFEILFCGEEPSAGVRKGVVVDVDKTSRIIRILFDRIKEETGHRVSSVFVNIGGGHLCCALSRGMVAVSRADRNISKEDVDRVLQEAARAVSLPSNNEILETFSKEFIVDGAGGIKEAKGLQGGRLETEVLVLAGFTPYKNNLVQAVLEAGLQIADVVPGAFASSSVVLSQKQKDLGAAVLDIGAGTSELAVFEEGDLVHLAVFPIGSGNITSDIAIGLKTDVDVAEAIKIKLGSCVSTGKDKKEKVEVDGEDTLVFSRKTLAKIIAARVAEIFGETQKELKKISKQNLLPAGVVLTGGGAKLPGIVELAKKELKLPCRLGKMSAFKELEGKLDYATVCGLVYRGDGAESGWVFDKGHSFSDGFGSKIKRILKNFLP